MATPEQIAAAWGAWRVRHKGSMGPGPGFVEAIDAALAVSPDLRITALEKENAELRQLATRVVADAKLTDVFGNGAKHYIVTPYLIDALRTALRDGGEK